MGWHTRHASTRSGLEGHSRPETLNLTAWNHALGLHMREEEEEEESTKKLKTQEKNETRELSLSSFL